MPCLENTTKPIHTFLLAFVHTRYESKRVPIIPDEVHGIGYRTEYTFENIGYEFKNAGNHLSCLDE
jgi:hypothetical protein